MKNLNPKDNLLTNDKTYRKKEYSFSYIACTPFNRTKK